jgi:hypothetical protein
MNDDEWVEVERPKLTFGYIALMAIHSLFQFKPTYMAPSKSDDSQCTSIQLPNLGNSSLERLDEMSIKSTPISCSVEKESETYRIYLSIGETSCILTTGHKINADFIMKMAVKFGYFQIRLCDLRNIVRSVFSGISVETRRGIIRYIKPYLVNKRVYYDGLKEYKEEDVNFDESDKEE